MKRFDFRLQKVLNYKNQILDSLKHEHSAILMQIYNQESVIKELNSGYFTACRKCNKEKASVTIRLEQVMQYDAYLDSLNKRIEYESGVLEALRKKEEKKRAEVIIAKQDVESIEKLKDKQLDVYRKDLQIEQELVVEEFITNRISSV